MQLLSNLYDRILADRYNAETNTYDWQPGDKDKLDQLRDGIAEYIENSAASRQD